MKYLTAKKLLTELLKNRNDEYRLMVGFYRSENEWVQALDQFEIQESQGEGLRFVLKFSPNMADVVDVYDQRKDS